MGSIIRLLMGDARSSDCSSCVRFAVAARSFSVCWLVENDGRTTAVGRNYGQHAPEHPSTHTVLSHIPRLYNTSLKSVFPTSKLWLQVQHMHTLIAEKIETGHTGAGLHNPYKV